MSYILDALRRADAQRERGALPGLHTRSALPPSADGVPRAAARPLLWMACGAALVLAAALAWTLAGSDTPAAPPPSASQVAAAAAVPAPPQVVEPRVADAAPPPVEADAPAPRPAKTEPPRAAPPKHSSGKALPAAAPATAERKPTTALGAARPVVPPAHAAPPAGDKERVYALHELPPQIRRDVPALKISGAIYSPTPASRFVMVNGQLLHEGDPIAPDVSLQEIRLKAAVLNVKGYRVSISY